jgi:hypothetical protein
LLVRRQRGTPVLLRRSLESRERRRARSFGGRLASTY